MQIYGWELLAVFYHPDKSFDHKNCDAKDIVFFICHMTSLEHMFKGLFEFVGGSPNDMSLPSHV